MVEVTRCELPAVDRLEQAKRVGMEGDRGKAGPIHRRVVGDVEGRQVIAVFRNRGQRLPLYLGGAWSSEWVE